MPGEKNRAKKQTINNNNCQRISMSVDVFVLQKVFFPRNNYEGCNVYLPTICRPCQISLHRNGIYCKLLLENVLNTHMSAELVPHSISKTTSPSLIKTITSSNSFQRKYRIASPGCCPVSSVTPYCQIGIIALSKKSQVRIFKIFTSLQDCSFSVFS